MVYVSHLDQSYQYHQKISHPIHSRKLVHSFKYQLLSAVITFDKKLHDVYYELTFTMSKDVDNKCPNCGAKLGDEASTMCPYCNSTVINKKHGAPSTKEFLTSLFGNCEVLDKKAGFNVMKCVKE